MNELGQINLGSLLGNILFDYASNSDYENYLEIGTWNGRGSTNCIIKGLRQRINPLWNFTSVESNKVFFDSAKSFHTHNLKKMPKFKLELGRIVDSGEIKKTGFDVESLVGNGEFKPQYGGFLEADLKDYDDCPMLDLAESYDVVLLDGGEFTTYAEFLKLKDRTKIFILDDCHMLKTKKVAQELKDSKDWELIDKSDDRNGFAIFERK